ncbi:DUF1731 domain-containing protein [Tsukamurella sp. PLM1]|uniref:DUF1731 domain-containing protein n=1 Tax=Tsukamurella sp. PLM1 TaxID=2929795 RepID=UPI0020675274|nr:DUF1731 domain-containing protein [Tsukamurella sp. PLM1]BDH58025.1 hypothetical protein MTP03_29640 [Tsukamurella sp. PLM1]
MTGVARPWEEAVADAETEHLTVLRTSIVLDTDSPAMAKMVGVTRTFLGGSLGDGRQWFSWIHRDDWLAVVRAGLGIEPGVEVPDGVVVAAAPNPVRNADLMRALRRHLHRPFAPPTPARVLALGAIGMRSDPALGLTGRHATSTVLPAAGHRFAYPDLDGALEDLLG